MTEFVLSIRNQYLDCFVEAVARWDGKVLCYEETDDYWTRLRVKVTDPIDLFFIGRCYMCNLIAQEGEGCCLL